MYAPASRITGQCHRYSEYEMSPTYPQTGLLSGSAHTRGTAVVPASTSTTTAVASTGTAAAGAGNTVLGPIAAALITIVTTPTSISGPRAGPSRVGRFGHRSRTNARQAPTPSSHARAGVLK